MSNIKKTWTIEVEIKDGKVYQNRINDGFTAIELLGLLEFAKQDVMDQMKGIGAPDYVSRQVVGKNPKYHTVTKVK